MFNQKIENINPKMPSESGKDKLADEEGTLIHTMQDDLDALSGIFPKKDNTVSFDKKEPANNSKIEEKPKEGQYFNPFLDEEVAKKQEKIVDFANKSTIPPGNDPISKEPGIERKAPSKKIVYLVISFLAAGIFFSGGYYFWKNRATSSDNFNNTTATKTENTAENTNKSNNEETTKTEPVLKYSADKPNYLTIDTENPSYENFNSLVKKASLDIKNSGINKPVEFVITDNKNNPITFPVFSVISKIKLSDELLKNLGDKFSIFAYTDSGNVRLALSIDLVNKAEAISAIRKEEPKLAEEMMLLFMENVALPKNKVVFKDADYKSINIRYFNLDDNPLVAIDYAFVGNQLIIGTSKNSMLTAIDKVLSGNK